MVLGTHPAKLVLPSNLVRPLLFLLLYDVWQRSNSRTLNVRRLLLPLLAAVCLLSIALPAQQPASALPYTVVTKDARRPLAVRLMGGQEMFALDDLARLFGLTVREDTRPAG